MKKLNILLVFVVCLSLFIVLVGCNNTNPTNLDSQNKEYTITATDTNDYKLTPSVTKAKAGDKVQVTVEILSADAYIKAVKYNGNATTTTKTGYEFTMPAENVVLTAESAQRTVVTSDGIATFDEANLIEVVKNGAHNAHWWLDENKWGLDVNFDTNYMAQLKSKITSSNQAVLPDSAITVHTYTKKDLGIGGANEFEIVKAKVEIDTSKVNVGTTWLTMEFENAILSGTSNSGTLVIKVTVVESGEVSVQTF